MGNKLKKSVAVLLTATMVATPITAPESTKKVQAEQLGSIAKEVTGTWSYWDGNKDVVQTNKMLLDKLPTRANQGTYRFTTDNYDANTNAIDVGVSHHQCCGIIIHLHLENVFMQYQCHIVEPQMECMCQNHLL